MRYDFWEKNQKAGPDRGFEKRKRRKDRFHSSIFSFEIFNFLGSGSEIKINSVSRIPGTPLLEALRISEYRISLNVTAHQLYWCEIWAIAIELYPIAVPPLSPKVHSWASFASTRHTYLCHRLSRGWQLFASERT